VSRDSPETAASLHSNCATALLVVVAADVPPSLNVLGASSGWRQFARKKKAWQAQIELLLMAGKLPRGLAHVYVTAELRFPSKRRRDEGNYRVMLEKATGDALVNGGWLADDTPEQYRFGTVEFDQEAGAAETRLRFSYRKGDGEA
jgi:hypothetical protein